MVEPGIYNHYKGGRYTVLFGAFNSDNAADRDEVVVYVSHTTGLVYVHSEREFTEDVVANGGIIRPRFIKVAGF